METESSLEGSPGPGPCPCRAIRVYKTSRRGRGSVQLTGAQQANEIDRNIRGLISPQHRYTEVMKPLVLASVALLLLASQVSSSPTGESTTKADSDDAESTTISGTEGPSKHPQTKNLKEQIAALTESCKQTAKITPDQMKIIAAPAVPKTEAERCFLQCIYDGIGLSKDGKFNEEGARNLAKQRFASSPDELAKANAMIDTCAKEVVVKDGSEKCSIGRLVRECIVKNGAKINFFPKP